MNIPAVLAHRWQTRRLFHHFADTALKSSVAFWFLVAVIGQGVFVLYILSFYGGSALRGNLGAWDKVLPHGIIPGDALGNISLAMHLLLTAIITLGGPLQLLPQVRARAPTFHHWNGRIYLLTAVAASISGLYMVWFRGGAGSTVQHIGISLNAVLIMLCGAMALRFALARNFAVHRRWALRLFLLVSGVWFFRVGLFLWLIPFGCLAYKSRFIPRIFGILLILAGAAYMTDSFISLLFPAYRTFVNQPTLLLVAIGEISIMLWFLIKGVTTQSGASSLSRCWK